MATFFGEVVSRFSRAVEEDDEELMEEDEEDREIRRELQKKREVHVQWSPEISLLNEKHIDQTLPCSNFILAIGQNAGGFLSSFILNSEKWDVIGSVSLWNERCKIFHTTEFQAPTDLSCVLYRLRSDPTVFSCQCNCYVAEDQQFQWTEKVFSRIQKRELRVTILSTYPVADYRTSDSTYMLPVPFLRALRTKYFKETTCCPVLEQPNVATGLPAAVLSYCQVWQIPAVLYHCYTDVCNPDSITVKAFIPLLSSVHLKRLVKDTSEAEKILKKFVNRSEVQSNLYT